MLRRWIRHRIPRPEQFDRYPITRWCKPWLSHPGLWAINRRSVSGGIAAGLFCGLIPGPFQVGGALVWCVIAKVNLPIAFVTTLYTNPLSIVPLYVFAIAYGQLLLGEVGHVEMAPLPEWDWSNMAASTHAYLDWGLGLGPALAVGLPATMVTFSAVGYVAVRLGWNLAIRLAVIRRRKRRLAEKEGGRF